MKKRVLIVLLALLALALLSCSAEQPPQASIDEPVAASFAPRPSATPAPTPTPTPTPTPDPVDSLLASMTLREKAAQMFFLRLSQPGDEGEVGFTKPDDELKAFIEDTQAGGYILFADNITSEAAVKALTGATVSHSSVAPFIGIDEEGGIVSRLSGMDGYESQPAAREIGKGEPQAAYDAGSAIASALSRIGVTVDFAPVADVLTNPENTVIGSRAYSDDPEVVAEMASAFARALMDAGILSAPKHFPGHGGTAEDSHEGAAVSGDTPEQIQETYTIYKRLIEEGAPFILAGHVTMPDSAEEPASLSPYFLTDVLRGELGFTGMVVTDAMNMQAITDLYPPDEANVRAISAGVDMVLMPQDFSTALDGVLAAVETGVLSKERIDESVRRILQLKMDYGIIPV